MGSLHWNPGSARSIMTSSNRNCFSLDLMVDEEDCKEAFKLYDKDDSGVIPKDELTALLRTMGQNPTDSEVNDMINEVDVDGSGVLDFNEFLTFVKRLAKNRNNPENEIRETFRRFDPESEGFVSTEELEFVLSNLPVKVPKPEIEEMLAAADTDNDGKISFQEFRRLVGM